MSVHDSKEAVSPSTDSSRKIHRQAPAKRTLPIGAEVQTGGGVHFRVWAPGSESVAVELSDALPFPRAPKLVRLDSEPSGYHSGLAPDAQPGAFYRFCLAQGSFPDPASRFQPAGPHGPSQVIAPGQFRWSDPAWKGPAQGSQIIYELHVGTFTAEGTWAAATDELPALADLGITMIELMPVADFPGRFGWGYDGVDLFAPTRLYGRPDDFRSFVNRAHELGLSVILDVVYNHLGPDGNFLKEFSPAYFTDRHKNEWGQAINFDDENSGPVREFFITNAGYWVDEYHLDGLRLDATQQIFDCSKDHVLAAITRQVRSAGRGRSTYVVAENESQESHLVRAPSEGGFGLDAIWNDDFHHAARVALTGRIDAYYADYRGRPQEFISAVKWGFLFQGQHYTWQKKRRGTRSLDLEPWNFVTYLQNHDQVANSLGGLRADRLAGPGKLRALTALLLLGPASPMLFQGQEFGASSPFLFFADHNPELAALVAKGRREFLRQFKTIADAQGELNAIQPHFEETFRRSKLNLGERETHRATYLLHKDLIRLRRHDSVFSKPRRQGVDGAVLGPDAFILRFFAGDEQDRLLLVNLGVDLKLSPAPEPLLAPLAGHVWRVQWSSEDPRYGGSGTPPLGGEAAWWIPGNAALVLCPEEIVDNPHGEDHSEN